MSQNNALEPTLFRLRVAYPKLGRLKYLGHLELIHTVERIVRRAHLPYAVTQGFSPHMRIAYTSALPVGTSSAAEFFDVYLTELVPAAEALERLQAAAPADLRPLSASYVELRRPALAAEIDRAHYLIEIHLDEGVELTDDALAKAVRALMEHEGPVPFVRGKKSKSVDLRCALASVGSELYAEGLLQIELCVKCTNEGSLRPEIYIQALDQQLRGLNPGVDEQIVSAGMPKLALFASYQVERVSQGISDGTGVESSPMKLPEAAPDGSLLAGALARLRGALSNL